MCRYEFALGVSVVDWFRFYGLRAKMAENICRSSVTLFVKYSVCAETGSGSNGAAESQWYPQNNTVTINTGTWDETDIYGKEEVQNVQQENLLRTHLLLNIKHSVRWAGMKDKNVRG